MPNAASWLPLGMLGVLAAGSVAQADYARIVTAPGGDSPMVYDDHRSRLLAIARDGLFEWDGSSWNLRYGVAGWLGIHAFYDPYDHRIAALASYFEGRFDGARWTSVAIPTAPSGPSTFDPDRRRLVVFDPATAAISEWDGAQWIVQQPTPAPTPRAGAFAYDPLRRRTLLYGGAGGSDLWSWDGSAWTQLQANGAPGPRDGATLAYERSTGRMILYGGDTPPHSTWALSGTTGTSWTQLATTQDPGAREFAQLVWDGTGLLLRGGDHGRGNETWRLVNDDWKQLPSETPVPREHPALAFDPVRGEVVMFGGLRIDSPTSAAYVGDTWTFAGRWRRHAPALSPTARTGAHLAWSAANGAALLFGGAAAPNDTWLWNGAIWTQAMPAATPPQRDGFAMASDPLGGVLLFGGLGVGGVLGDHWYWNGGTWQLLAPSPLPPPRFDGLAALDPLRNRVVLTGGRDQNYTPFGDTWEWDGGAWQQLAGSPFGQYGASAQRIAFRPNTAVIRVEGPGAWEWGGSAWTASTVFYGYSPLQIVGDLRRGSVLRYPTGPVSGQTDSAIDVLTDEPATAAAYGSGCAIGPAPALTLTARPAPGEIGFGLRATTYAPGAPVFVAVGFQPQYAPLGAGCSQLVSAVAAVAWRVADAAGDAEFALPLPLDFSLRGIDLSAQAAVVDPQRALWSVLTLSDGLQLTIGD